MSKQLMFDYEAHQKILKGAKSLADTLRITLGPTGRNVLLDKSFGNPEIIKDGNAISKEVELPDPFENMGSKMISEAASKTSDVIGDGASVSALLAYAIYESGLKYLTSGANPVGLKNGIEKATSTIVDTLKEMSRPATEKSDYQNIATVSANRDEKIGKLIAEAMTKVGKEGVITVDEGKGRETTLEFTEGLSFDKGYISPYFVTNPENLTCVLNDCYILLYEKKITNLQEMLPLLEQVVQTGKSILIVAEEIEGEALTALVINKLQGSLKCCAVKTPAFGDRKKAIMEDIAIVTGGQFFSEELGAKLEEISVNNLGKAKSIKIDKDNTYIVEGAGAKKKIEARVAQIRNLIKTTTSDYDREKYEERLAKLVGGVAVIKVGALMETMIKEKKSVIENAVNSARAARDEGYLPGGGLAYLKCLPALEDLKEKTSNPDERMGITIVAQAMEIPLRQIADNSGRDGAMIVEDLKEKSKDDDPIGFDAFSGEYTHMIKAGIVDPTKLLRSAIQNASSIAGLMLSSRTLITDFKEKEKTIEGSIQ
ncbi:MAG: chaperonin GroEL [Candidatus Brocadiia bacterium]